MYLGSAKRVPWSGEEIQKLTDGVVEFASERKKWSLILTKVSETQRDTQRTHASRAPLPVHLSSQLSIVYCSLSLCVSTTSSFVTVRSSI
jgi:hypothetical protein